MPCGDRIINGKLPLICHELCHSQNPSGVGGGGVRCSQIYSTIWHSFLGLHFSINEMVPKCGLF